MENWGKWKIIKVGFWLGVGFIIPQLITMYVGVVITMFATPPMVEKSFEEEFSSNFNSTDQIEIISHKEKKNGNQLLILGEIKNTGNKKASSIKLEAELFDSNGKFVYECSDYVDKELMPGESENYQIVCGCGKNPIPEFNKVNLKVVRASSY